jgi:hypothetical protein
MKISSTKKMDLTIDFGNTASFTTTNFYTDSAVADNIKIFSGANAWVYFNSRDRQVTFRAASGFDTNFVNGKMTTKGADAGVRITSATGVDIATLENESGAGWFFLRNTTGTDKVYMYVDGNQYYFADGCAFGHSPATRGGIIDVKGIGSTSATTTALFQNSSSVAILTITDDKVATFGGRVISISAPIQLNTASSATPTPNADADGQFNLTALAANATFGAPTGTPTGGQKLMIRIKDNGTARTLAYNAIYRAIGITLPTTTVISKTLYIACIYNAADTKWDAIATAQEA